MALLDALFPRDAGPNNLRLGNHAAEPSMSERTLRGKTAIVGIGETTYYKHGQSPDSEFKLCLQAIVKACQDAGISPHEVDGFASYGGDRSEGPRLASALGCKVLNYSNM